MSEHRVLRESLGAYALGALPDDERLAVDAHLDGCASCRAELAEIRPVVGPLGTVDPAHLDETPTPPPWLGERIVSRARTERIPRAPGRGLPGRGLLVGVAAALVAALVGVVVGYAAGSGPAVPREQVAVQALAPAIEADASVVPHTWGVEITLDAQGFDAGAVYRVVVRDDSGREVDAGQFVGTGAQRMLCNLNSSVLRADAAGFEVRGDDGATVLSAVL